MRGRPGITVVTILACLCLGFVFADLATGQSPFDIDLGTSSKAGKSGAAQTLRTYEQPGWQHERAEGDCDRARGGRHRRV